MIKLHNVREMISSMDGDSPILPLIMTVSAQGAGSVIIFYAILFVLLVMGGAYFAGAEMALASVNRIRMMSLEDNGDKRARRVLYILDNFDKALSTILIGNNIMHIGCATIATLIATKLWGEGAVAYSTIITTVVLFFVSEMLPKFYAKACNERMALSVGSAHSAFVPVHKVQQGSQQAFRRGRRGRTDRDGG